MFCFYLPILTFIALFSNHTNASDPPIEFSAEYNLLHNNAQIGKVTLAVKKVAGDQYKLTSSTKTGSLAKLLGARDSTETSLFEHKNGQIRPLTYQYKDGKKNTELTFNWASSRVTNYSEKPTEVRLLQPGVLDGALMKIALMQDLNDATNKITYHSTDGGRFKAYSFTQLGKENINLTSGTYETIKVVRQKEKKKELMYYWFAKELHMLPVMITREKSFGSFKMTLSKVDFPNE
ncbi:MAG: hypothetical protein A6F71_05910 [Cycloclasticus sp. symbiont of Poecilosclerida sp. M]|nr:MAG: hypothetical protein A6F71_05910 [Cycloclasticus sp. symbiont of Poecilosclerida sp. M]